MSRGGSLAISTKGTILSLEIIGPITDISLIEKVYLRSATLRVVELVRLLIWLITVV